MEYAHEGNLYFFRRAVANSTLSFFHVDCTASLNVWRGHLSPPSAVHRGRDLLHAKSGGKELSKEPCRLILCCWMLLQASHNLYASDLQSTAESLFPSVCRID